MSDYYELDEDGNFYCNEEHIKNHYVLADLNALSILKDAQASSLITVKETNRTLESENARLKNKVIELRSSLNDAHRNLQNQVKRLKQENERHEKRWQELRKFTKDEKVNFTSDDRFWMGHADAISDIKSKMKELEAQE